MLQLITPGFTLSSAMSSSRCIACGIAFSGIDLIGTFRSAGL